MKSIFEKVKTYGIKGIVDFVLGKIVADGERRVFVANARRYPMKPQHGFTVVGKLSEVNSLSKTMRDFCFSLKDAGIPFQTFDLVKKPAVPDEDLLPILTPREEFRALKYDHVVEMFHSPFPDLPGVTRQRIIFWEFESGLLEYDPRVNDGAEIIAMSDFTLEVFQRLFKKVRKILYPFRFETTGLPPADEMRRRHGLGEKDFVVFYNFDLGSSPQRKNPSAALQAFAQAFRETPNARFLMKVAGARSREDDFQRLLREAETLGVRDKTVAVTDYLPQKELYGLTNACDVYLSLHRGEGFGLGIAEAMSLAKPVVVTNYSAPTEFCLAEETALVVPYRLVPVRPDQIDHPNYRFVREWAEPDVSAAAQALRRLYGDPALRTRLGTAAQALVKDHFSIDNFKASVNDFLHL